MGLEAKNSIEKKSATKEVEEVAKKTDVAKVGADFDKNHNAYSDQEYATIKAQIVQHIMERRRNDKYNTSLKAGKYQTDNLFVKEDPLLVKGYVAHYNLQIIKYNVNHNTNNPTVRVDDFMKNFEKERPQPTSSEKNLSSAGSSLSVDRVNQEVGKFINISEARQQDIIGKFSKVISANQKINTLKLYGYADATKVTELGQEKVQNQFASMRQTLIDKGMAVNKLPAADYFKGIETMTSSEKQNVLNKGWAVTRAMMQIAFLPADQIKYINGNTTNIQTLIDAKSVGTKEKGDKYTGGKIEMESTGSDKTIKGLTEVKTEALKMLDGIGVNYVVVDQNNSYYSVGGIGLTMKDGQMGIGNSTYNNTLYSETGNDGKIYPKAFLNDRHIGRFDNVVDKNKKVFLEKNRLNIRIDKPGGGYQIASLDEYGKNLFAHLDPRITDHGMDLAKNNKDVDALVGALTEAKNNSEGDKKISEYVEKIINILQIVKDVDLQLTNAQAVTKTEL